MARTFGEQRMDCDDLCDLCLTSGVNADRTTPCGKTIGIECGCDGSCKDGLCGDEDCEDCHPPDGGDPFDDGDGEEEADDLAAARVVLAQARPGQPLPETLDAALDALEAAVGDTPHEPLCPSRAGGECLCVRSRMIELLQLHDREV